MLPAANILPFDDLLHRAQVVALWKSVFGYEAPHNAPEVSIAKKLAVGDGLFFVAIDGHDVVGTVMAGYDGHRGWIYSMAVHPDWRKKGIGSALLGHAEARLSALGCVKINLQIIEGNESVQTFYSAHGYMKEKRISMGKKLPENIRGAP
jgi:ribosomal protein S18 acetylase RimI-like enzyme